MQRKLIAKELNNYLSNKCNLGREELLNLLNETIEYTFEFRHIYVELLNYTSDLRVVNKIALIMEKYPNEIYKKSLLKKYNCTLKGKRGTIFFALSIYDFSDIAESIFDKIIKDGLSDEEMMSLPDFINSMVLLDKSECIRLAKKYFEFDTESAQNIASSLLILSDDK